MKYPGRVPSLHTAKGSVVMCVSGRSAWFSAPLSLAFACAEGSERRSESTARRVSTMAVLSMAAASSVNTTRHTRSTRGSVCESGAAASYDKALSLVPFALPCSLARWCVVPSLNG